MIAYIYYKLGLDINLAVEVSNEYNPITSLDFGSEDSISEHLRRANTINKRPLPDKNTRMLAGAQRGLESGPKRPRLHQPGGRQPAGHEVVAGGGGQFEPQQHSEQQQGRTLLEISTIPAPHQSFLSSSTAGPGGVFFQATAPAPAQLEVSSPLPTIPLTPFIPLEAEDLINSTRNRLLAEVSAISSDGGTHDNSGATERQVLAANLPELSWQLGSEGNATEVQVDVSQVEAAFNSLELTDSGVQELHQGNTPVTVEVSGLVYNTTQKAYRATFGDKSTNSRNIMFDPLLEERLLADLTSDSGAAVLRVTDVKIGAKVVVIVKDYELLSRNIEVGKTTFVGDEFYKKMRRGNAPTSPSKIKVKLFPKPRK